MIEAMDLGEDQGLESQRIVAGELDWVDEMLSDGRSFLSGDRFSRADLAAASLLAPLATPKEHPTYGHLQIPPKLSSQIADWNQRRSVGWVRNMYATYR